MSRHLVDAEDAHANLLLQATNEVRAVSEKMALSVEKIARDEEGLDEGEREARDVVLVALREEEKRALEDIRALRENEADARARGALYADALEKALHDQAETYKSAIAELHAEMHALAEEFASYKKSTALELAALRDTVSAEEVRGREVSVRASLLTRGGGIFDEYRESVMNEIERDRETTLAEIDKATKKVLFELDDAKAENARAISTLREDVRVIMRGRLLPPK
jgi:TNF receptor-associated factor 4